MGMTNKLKKKIKRNIMILLVFASILVAGLAILKQTNSSLFVMPNHKTDALDLAEALETQAQELAIEELDNTESANPEEAGEESAADGETIQYPVITCDSIVQCVKENDLPDGNYIFRVTGKTETAEETIDYPVELINYKENVTYSLEEGETEKTISLGDTSEEYKMLIVKYHKNLNIDEGVTLTASTALDENGEETDLTYKKGMYICVVRRFNK